MGSGPGWARWEAEAREGQRGPSPSCQISQSAAPWLPGSHSGPGSRTQPRAPDPQGVPVPGFQDLALEQAEAVACRWAEPRASGRPGPAPGAPTRPSFGPAAQACPVQSGLGHGLHQAQGEERLWGPGPEWAAGPAALKGWLWAAHDFYKPTLESLVCCGHLLGDRASGLCRVHLASTGPLLPLPPPRIGT